MVYYGTTYMCEKEITAIGREWSWLQKYSYEEEQTSSYIYDTSESVYIYLKYRCILVLMVFL